MAAPKVVTSRCQNIAVGQKASGKTITAGKGLSDTLMPHGNATSPEENKKDGGGTTTTLATSFIATVAPKVVTSRCQNIGAGQKASSKA
jgi:hypothetical protein